MITLRNKIGQMLIMGFTGAEINEHSPVAHWLEQDGLGGVLLFDQDAVSGAYGKNLRNQTQIKALTQQLRACAAQAYDDEKEQLPLLIAVDYEGGAIDRLAHIEGCVSTITAADMAKLSDKALHAELRQMAETLKDLGFNLNFAPVVDLHMHEAHGIIGALQRSFSDDPEVVARLAREFVTVFSQYGIATSYKHFPGHGSALGDTHQGFVDVTDTYSSAELLPYQKLIEDACPLAMIMTAHVINKHLDAQGLPATLSQQILTRLLREQMGYEGVIVSDDLQMQSITDHYALEDALCLTINAGADMIIFANQLGQIAAPEVIECVERLVLQQKIAQQRIDSAYNRIVRLKQRLILS